MKKKSVSKAEFAIVNGCIVSEEDDALTYDFN